ncbi:MAG TPA: hypothetical protein PKE29_02470 [Phycisphaerales bacterium]|nr:hypothetical protein [Phycisphaerales bacterium]
MRHHQLKPTVSPNRLCAAADRLLAAIDSPQGRNAPVVVYTGPLRRAGRVCEDAFTCEEFIEAMAMLIRMGLVPKRAIGSRDWPNR